MNTKETIKILTEHSCRLSQQTYTPDNRDLMEAIDFAVKRLSKFIGYQRPKRYNYQLLKVGETEIVNLKKGETPKILQDRVRATIISYNKRTPTKEKYKINQLGNGVKITRVA